MEDTGKSDWADNITYRRRKFSSKTRTGCITCKIRKIKCDEAKPSCHRCTSTGRKCDGYVLTAPKVIRLVQQPGLQSSSNTAERQALYMFRTKIATLIASAFDVGFWTRHLLQTAEAYQSVHHAVAALSTAYHVSTLPSQGCHVEKQFILTQYSKSISSLNQYLAKARFRSRKQQIVVLITNILFICICALQESCAEAYLHLQSGLSLLREWKFGVAEVVDSSEITPVPVKQLAIVYTQLDTQARIIIEANDQHERKPWIAHNVALDGWGNGHLETVTKAMSQVERLHNRALQNTALPPLVETSSNYHLHLMTDYRRQLSIWDSNFGRLLCNSDDKCNSIRALRMRRLLVGANLEVTLRAADNTSEHDRTWFKEILDLADQIIQDLTSQEGGIVFSLAGGFVEALYFVATRSQESSIQRKAVDLLEKYPIIEGLWNSSTALEALARRGLQHHK